MLSENNSEDDVQSLRKKIESLNSLLGTMNEETSQTFEKLEKHIKSQEYFNANIVRLLDEKGMSSSIQSFPEDEIVVSPNNHLDGTGNVPSERVKINSFTQTNLAIDPETSIKLSFISAGISSYGYSFENSMGRHVITATPAASNEFNRYNTHHKAMQSQGQVQTARVDRVSPIELNNEFSDGIVPGQQQSPPDLDDRANLSPQSDKHPSKPPTFPSANTPSNPTAPLKSILRTPTQEKPPSSGPLSSYSPSLSPIQNAMTPKMDKNREKNGLIDIRKQNRHYLDDSFYDERKGQPNEAHSNISDVNLSASIFTAPLQYDSSDGETSLRSVSMLDVTSNTLAVPEAGILGSHSANGKENPSRRQKKSPARRRKVSDIGDSSVLHAARVKVNPQLRDKIFDGVYGTSGEESDAFNTPTKDRLSTFRSVHTTGHKNSKTQSIGYISQLHFSDSKRTSRFWKDRLGKRDMTSVLTSPLCQKLF